eukprot:TRINITY_DN27114_c0_g1_i1.p1 TRINITY_DN27114_c0_g1~~TRINITY_DN27114_c0_g1_i1.p1  ORF type:complete len:284 (+),score=28.70 TRINITY_DN27114_c0_g1_i1:369-1220(+)
MVDSLPYQLFLPAGWTAERQWPVVVFLHGAGDGAFSVMNSQSLPRLLARNQSTSFDPRPCWCLPHRYAGAAAMAEAGSDAPFLPTVVNINSPMADCRFADKLEAIVVMPQGWLPSDMKVGSQGWASKQSAVQKLTARIIRDFSGNPARVVLLGQSAGGFGAFGFAQTSPRLWSAVGVICAPWVWRHPHQELLQVLEGLPMWIVGWTGDGEHGNDEFVATLKRRGQPNITRYTRYVRAPGPPDPLYRSMLNHASYDLILRDPRFWEWMLAQRNSVGAEQWAAIA